MTQICGRHTAAISAETLDGNLTALVRLVLGLMTLLVAAVEPREDVQLDPVIVAVIVAHIAYASVAYVLVLRRSSTAATHALNYRVDAVTFVLLISITGGTDDAISYFAILLFLFAAMTASLGWGVGAGLRLTMITAGLFSVAMLGRAGMSNFEGSHAFLHLSYILGLGVVAARWSGHHFTLHRRLGLLRDAGALSNPRFGVDRTIGARLERLRGFYDAHTCLLVTKSAEGAGWRLRRCERDRSDGAVHEEVLPPELEDALLCLPRDTLAVYARQPFYRQWLGYGCSWYEERRMDGSFGNRQVSYSQTSPESLLARFGGRSWLSVPVYSGRHCLGRLHLTGGQAFDLCDAEFAFQVIQNGMLVIENIRLLDQLASGAAIRERQRLARDIHDRVIQPYIGLQLALVAVQRTLRSGNSDAAGDEVRRLLDLTAAAIDDLRADVGDLKSATGPDGKGLLPALRRYAAQFTEDTGIAVEIGGSEAVGYGDRLGAELFQMVVEALSNVRRHTVATRAAIRFLPHEDDITLQVENQEPEGKRKAFTPGSISERATALGGHVTVDRRRDGRTIVEVRIPL
jgi:signal transduction histidine kinase